jgi:hypothetical protein
VGAISFVYIICSSERRRELWCEEWCEERNEGKEGSWGPLFFSETRAFVSSNWVPLENLFWYWKVAPIGYYLRTGTKFLAVNMERLLSHQQKLQFSPSSHYHHFFTHLQGQYPSLGKLQRKKLPLPLHPSYKCNPVLSFCSTSTTITTPTTVAGEHLPPDSTRGISYMNREVFTKLLLCWKILVCVFLLFFEIWFCQLGDNVFAGWSSVSSWRSFLLRKKNAPEAFNFHLPSLSLFLSLSLCKLLFGSWMELISSRKRFRAS